MMLKTSCTCNKLLYDKKKKYTWALLFKKTVKKTHTHTHKTNAQIQPRKFERSIRSRPKNAGLKAAKEDVPN